MFATGNNVLFKGDMVRRGLVCNLEALDERPELREFRERCARPALADRGTYVAAALTIIRAYLAAGAPQVCGPFGSYAGLVAHGSQPACLAGRARSDREHGFGARRGPGACDIRELFGLWPDYFDLDQKVTTGQVIEAACAAPAGNDYNRQPLKDLLLRVASDRDGGGGGISAKRLGWWLRGISGRVEAGYRLNTGRLDKSRAYFWLAKVAELRSWFLVFLE